MNTLQNLKPSGNQKKGRKRLGRGNGSGKGTFSGKGCKGQTARSGGKRRPGFEGGQTPLYRKMPKLKGFKNINRVEYKVLNLDVLEANFGDKGKVNRDDLIKAGFMKASELVKLGGRGEITKKIEVTVDKATKSAKEAVEKAGGKVVELLSTGEEKSSKKKSEDAPKEETA